MKIVDCRSVKAGKCRTERQSYIKAGGDREDGRTYGCRREPGRRGSL